MSISIKQACDNAMYIYNRCGNDPSIYSMQHRGYGPDASQYDCSSFMSTIWEAGVAYNTNTMVYGDSQGHLGFPGLGFSVLTGDQLPTINQLKKGDILVNPTPGEEGHTAMVWDKKQQLLMQCTGSNGVTNQLGYSSFTTWSIVLRPDNQAGGDSVTIAHWVPTDGIHDGF